jgi:hypothetical protein
VIDEDAAHHFRRHGEEVPAVVPPGVALVDEPKVGLMNEGGWLENMSPALGPKPGCRAPAQVLVDHFDEMVAGNQVALAPGVKQGGHIGSGMVQMALGRAILTVSRRSVK